MWRIKYLPRALEEICGRDKIIKNLKEIIAQKNFPHLIFVGADGVGKTTIARLFAKQFLGAAFDSNFRLTYADVPLTEEERQQAKSEAYISTSKIGSTAGKTITTPAFIAAKVKPFVQLKAFGDAPFKILAVKNFEALGSNQQGFRRLMEIYGSNCRMILITKKISGVIDPIVSRCQIFLVSQVEFDAFKQLMLEIGKKEKLDIEEDALEVLYKVSEGKISRAIDLLQLCNASSSKITLQSLYDSAQKFQKDMVRSLVIMVLTKKNFTMARDQARTIMSTYKYSAQEFFQQVLIEVQKLPISRFEKTKLITAIADVDFRTIDGQDDDIQVSALLSRMCVFAEKM